MQETRVQFLGQEDPLEREMATHSNILAWRIPWTEELGRLPSVRSQELDTIERLNGTELNIPLFICTILSLSICLLMDI